MRDQELVNALRCTSSPGEPIGDCKKCRFYKTEPVPEDLVGKVDLTEWFSCDVDAIGFAAADRIANQSTHIAALQQEIEKLRSQNEQLREAAALVTAEAADRIEAQAKEIDALRNELCLKCGNYTLAHDGACDGCRWREMRHEA